MVFQPNHERRRGKRIHLSFHVEVCGVANGVPFVDQASASDVSDRGCQIVLSRQLKAGDLLTLRVIRQIQDDVNDRTFLYQVVWVEICADAWSLGLAAMDGGNPWHINFPEKSLVPSKTE